MAKKFDFIPIIVRDPLEVELKIGGKITFRDAESGKVKVFDGKELSNKLTETRKARDEKLHHLFNINGLDRIDITTGEDYVGSIHRLFQRRLP